ncbi:hypothetical protein FQN60_013164 [Etheostoma spectabile]|uniref:Uncharacterized protein n=1 Tax=Etheostoma spectabile TaxID=54343 RepID=A0A5J5D8L6_9PERO|nr:hypothetical protein FQN60_013164 [Etheostoma spectabile]
MWLSGALASPRARRGREGGLLQRHAAPCSLQPGYRLLPLFCSLLSVLSVRKQIRNFDRSTVRSRSFRRLNRAFSVLRRTKSGNAVSNETSEERDNARNSNLFSFFISFSVHLVSHLPLLPPTQPGSTGLHQLDGVVPRERCALNVVDA